MDAYEDLYIRLSLDGDLWCALLGENLQEGTAGFGDTRYDAIRALVDEMESGGI